MNRTLLIARREYMAYARTVGFWLSLLAFPLFAVLGGAVPILMKTSEPMRVVAVVEQGQGAQGLAAAVQEALASDAQRRDAARRRSRREGRRSGRPDLGRRQRPEIPVATHHAAGSGA